MDKVTRIYKLHKIFKSARYPLTSKQIAASLQCSSRSINRHINEYIDEFGAPIEKTKEHKYQYTDKTFELPGIWLNATELIALATMQSILKDVETGIFKQQFKLFENQIQKIYQKGKIEKDIFDRIKVINIGKRCFNEEQYIHIAEALIRRKQIEITYKSRGNIEQEATRRIISPQRLIRYRDNWYLDCYCHLREGLRTLALEQISIITTKGNKAKEIPQDQLNQHFGTAYGIFGGTPDKTAILKFTPYRAQWISHEQWHPDQIGELNNDGSYTLQLPYLNDKELLLDILRFGADVKVLEPQPLKEEVKKRLKQALEQYQNE